MELKPRKPGLSEKVPTRMVVFFLFSLFDDDDNLFNEAAPSATGGRSGASICTFTVAAEYAQLSLASFQSIKYMFLNFFFLINNLNL